MELPIRDFGDRGATFIYAKNDLVSFFRTTDPRTGIPFHMLDLSVGSLRIMGVFRGTKQSVQCNDIHRGKQINITFERELTVQEAAEELSLKFMYNYDRILDRIRNTYEPEIELALPAKRGKKPV
jgi:hypothetical protein